LNVKSCGCLFEENKKNFIRLLKPKICESCGKHYLSATHNVKYKKTQNLCKKCGQDWRNKKNYKKYYRMARTKVGKVPYKRYKYSNNTSGVLGVYYRKDSGMWRARIGEGYNLINLGTYPTKREAIKARKDAEKGIFPVKWKPKGYYWSESKKRFIVEKAYNGKKYYIGSFADENEAAVAVEEADGRVKAGLSPK